MGMNMPAIDKMQWTIIVVAQGGCWGGIQQDACTKRAASCGKCIGWLAGGMVEAGSWKPGVLEWKPRLEFVHRPNLKSVAAPLSRAPTSRQK